MRVRLILEGDSLEDVEDMDRLELSDLLDDERLLQILFAVGAGDQVIGRDEFSDYPAEAAELPSIGGGFGDYNLEAIVDLQPDLVCPSLNR